MQLFDTHAHLDQTEFDTDRVEVIARLAGTTSARQQNGEIHVSRRIIRLKPDSFAVGCFGARDLVSLGKK